MIFCIFYKVNLTGSGLFKKDWSGNRLLTWWKVQKNHFYYWKNEKIPEVPTSVTGPATVQNSNAPMRQNILFSGRNARRKQNNMPPTIARLHGWPWGHKLYRRSILLLLHLPPLPPPPRQASTDTMTVFRPKVPGVMALENVPWRVGGSGRPAERERPCAVKVGPINYSQAIGDVWTLPTAHATQDWRLQNWFFEESASQEVIGKRTEADIRLRSSIRKSSRRTVGNSCWARPNTKKHKKKSLMRQGA